MPDPLAFVGEKRNRRQEFVAYVLLSNINGTMFVCSGITMERIYCTVLLTHTFLFLLILQFRLCTVLIQHFCFLGLR